MSTRQCQCVSPGDWVGGRGADWRSLPPGSITKQNVYDHAITGAVQAPVSQKFTYISCTISSFP